MAGKTSQLEEPILLKIALGLSRPDYLATKPDWVDRAIFELGGAAAQMEWHYVSYICLMHHFTKGDGVLAPDDSDQINGLIALSIHNHRVPDALQISMASRNGISPIPLPAKISLPARKWSQGSSDRLVDVETIQDIIKAIQADGLKVAAGPRRQFWILRRLHARFKELNNRLKDGALRRLLQHGTALDVYKWKRLVKRSPDVVHVRLTYGTGLLNVSVQIGIVGAEHELMLPFALKKFATTEDLKTADTHFGPRALANLVYQILVGIQSGQPEPEIIPRLHWLYTFLLGRVLERPEVAAAIADLENLPTLVVVTHGILAQVPFAALHDGSSYLNERFNIVQAPLLYPEAEFGTGDLDHEALAGGDPLAPDDRVRILADVVGLPEAKEELEGYERLRSSTTLNIEIGQCGQNDDWAIEDLHWLFSGDISILSSHIRTSATDVRHSALMTPVGKAILFRDAVPLATNTKLVVLAGCDSQGQTNWYGSSENSIVSLLRRRGVQSVISSLWNVNDVAARLYNEALLAAIGRGLSRAQAHGEAMRHVKNSQPAEFERGIDRRATEATENQTHNNPRVPEWPGHPIFWAPFTLSGAWR